MQKETTGVWLDSLNGNMPKVVCCMMYFMKNILLGDCRDMNSRQRQMCSKSNIGFLKRGQFHETNTRISLHMRFMPTVQKSDGFLVYEFITCIGFWMPFLNFAWLSFFACLYYIFYSSEVIRIWTQGILNTVWVQLIISTYMKCTSFSTFLVTTSGQ